GLGLPRRGSADAYPFLGQLSARVSTGRSLAEAALIARSFRTAPKAKAASSYEQTMHHRRTTGHAGGMRANERGASPSDAEFAPLVFAADRVLRALRCLRYLGIRG